MSNQVEGRWHMKKTNLILGGVIFLAGIFMVSLVPMASADPVVDSQKNQATLNAQNVQNSNTAPVNKTHKKGHRHHKKTTPTTTVTPDPTK